MENKKFTKRAVLTSVIAVLLCCALLVGGTFAWFTDTATTGINTIESGNLDIELYYATQADVVDGAIAEEAWKPVSADQSVFNENALWEPGYTEIVYFKAANLGNLSLKYHMDVEIYNEKSSTNKYGAEFKLSDYIVGYAQQAMDYQFQPYTSRADAIAPAGAPEVYYTTLADAVSGAYDGWETNNYSSTSMNMSQWLEPEETFYTTLVLWMPEEVGNEANYLEHEDVTAPQIQLGVSVTATQYSWENHEVDSFDHTYDENAEYIGIEISPDVTDNNVVIEEGETTVIDLKQGTMENGLVLNENSEAVLKNGTLSVPQAGVQNAGGNLEVTNMDLNAGSATSYAVISTGDSYTVLNDVDMATAGGGVGAAGGAEVVFNSGSIDLNTTSTSGRYLFYAEGEGTVITINDGNFDFNKTQNQKRAYVYAGAGTTVYINGGTFGAASTRSGYTDGLLGPGNIVVTGGTFGFNPTKWVAEGHTVTQDGNTWVVE